MHHDNHHSYYPWVLEDAQNFSPTKRWCRLWIMATWRPGLSMHQWSMEICQSQQSLLQMSAGHRAWQTCYLAGKEWNSSFYPHATHQLPTSAYNPKCCFCLHHLAYPQTIPFHTRTHVPDFPSEMCPQYMFHPRCLLRSCPNGDWIWIGDVGDDRCCQCWSVMLVMIGDDGVQTDFGFSFDAVPTIDTVLYFRVDKGRRRWTEEDRVDLRDTSSSRTS